MIENHKEALATLGSKLVGFLKDKISDKKDPFPILAILYIDPDDRDNPDKIVAAFVDISQFDCDEKMGGLRPFVIDNIRDGIAVGLNIIGIVHVFDSYVGELTYQTGPEPTPSQIHAIMKTESYKKVRRDAIVCNTHIPGSTRTVAFPYRNIAGGGTIFDDPKIIGDKVEGRLTDFFPENLSADPIKN